MSTLKETLEKILKEDALDGTGTPVKSPAGPINSKDPEFDNCEVQENPEVRDPYETPLEEIEEDKVDVDPTLTDVTDTQDPANPHEVTQMGQAMPVMPVAQMGTYMRESIAALQLEDVKVDRAAFDKLFEGQELSAEFKTKCADLFEQTCNETSAKAIASAIKMIVTESMKLFEAKVNEEVENIKTISEETSKKWLIENQLVIESAIRADLADSFITKLKTLFVEHFIEIPASKVNLLEAFQTRINKLEEDTGAAMKKEIDAKKALTEAQKTIAVMTFTKGMTDMATSKVVKIAESVEFTTAEEFTAKLKTLNESTPNAEVKPTEKKVDPTTILESTGNPVSEVPVETTVVTDPLVKAYTDALVWMNKE